MIFLVPFIWILFGIASAIVAGNKGRSGCSWFLLGFLLGPFGLLFVLLSGSRPAAQSGPRPVTVAPELPDTKICPACAEEIKIAALKCKHCGEVFDPVATAELVTAHQTEAEKLLDPTVCPYCRLPGVTNAFLGDGSFGPWCPNCKQAI
jgi:hypothetical protein